MDCCAQIVDVNDDGSTVVAPTRQLRSSFVVASFSLGCVCSVDAHIAHVSFRFAFLDSHTYAPNSTPPSPNSVSPRACLKCPPPPLPMQPPQLQPRLMLRASSGCGRSMRSRWLNRSSIKMKEWTSTRRQVRTNMSDD